VHTVVFVHAVS